MRRSTAIIALLLVAASCSDGTAEEADRTSPPPGPTAAPDTTDVTATTTPGTRPTAGTTITAPPSSQAATPPTSTFPTNVAADDGTIPSELDLDLVDCERMTTSTRVDAAVAASYLGPLDTAEIDDGRALFSLSVLHCSDLRTGGRSHGAGGFATAWLRLVDTARPTMPDDADIDPTGTDHYAALTFQTDNPAFVEAATAFGIPMRLADMTFDPSAAGIQTGTVTQDWTDPPLTYRWNVDNTRTGTIATNDAVHTLHGTTVEGIPLTYVGRFTHEVPGWLGNPATVEFDDGSYLDDLVGGGYQVPGNGTDISVRMIVMRDDPVDVFESTVVNFPIAAGPSTRIRVAAPDGPCEDRSRPGIVGSGWIVNELVDAGYVAVQIALDHDAAPSLDEALIADITRAIDHYGTAVRWLRAHADEYCVAPDAIAVIGYSWTGIASLAMIYSSGEFEPGDTIGIDEYDGSAEVPDVPALPIPPNLADFPDEPAAAISIAGFALADTIDAGEPPALLINGRNDTTVPFELAEATCDAAAAVGVTCELIAHDEGHAGTPETIDTIGIIADFLERELAPAMSSAAASN